jgi:hypothetical protein
LVAAVVPVSLFFSVEVAVSMLVELSGKYAVTPNAVAEKYSRSDLMRTEFDLP